MEGGGLCRREGFLECEGEFFCMAKHTKFIDEGGPASNREYDKEEKDASSEEIGFGI